MTNVISGVEKDRYNSTNAFLESGHQERYSLVMSVIGRHLKSQNWQGKTVFDIACGTGGYGRKFAELGADVYYFDGRPQNFDLFPGGVRPDRRFVVNLETDPFPQGLPKADLILLMGILYHVGDPLGVIRKVSSLGDHICIETSAMDHDGVAIVYFEETSLPNHSSVTGRACRPSPGWLKKVLNEEGHFDFVRDISHADANHAPSPGFGGERYDWEFQRTCGWRRDDYSLRKLIIASKNEDVAKSVWTA